MSTEDPLVESVISTLLGNVESCGETSKYSSAYYEYVEINRNLDDLNDLYKEGLISKERITGTLISVRNSEAYKNCDGIPSDSDICKKTDKLTMLVLKKKI